jgi:hypothetical protein
MQSFIRLFPVILSFFLFPVCGGAQDATAPVLFSIPGGFFDTPFYVELSCVTPGAEIRFTLDGSEPDSQSILYPGQPVVVGAPLAFRARAFAPGMAPSVITTQSYFVGVEHVFPVVSLAFEPAAFFDSTIGIYTNFSQDLTAITNIEFFEPGVNSSVLNQLVEVEIQGTGSAGLPQKSLEIKAKESLGADKLQYPVFPDLPFDEYKRIVLRNGGQDWCVLHFRDEFATSLLQDRTDMGDILAAPALHFQAWRPAVVYLNGKYWGIHNVRERMNRFYVRQHFDWDQDEFDLVENFGEVSSGDSEAWLELFNFLSQNNVDFSQDSIFGFLKQKIDYQNYLDYCAFNIYLENEDWPGNNVLRFRHRSDAGKWQWLTYDLDFTFGLYQGGGGWNTGDPSPNALARLLDGSALVWPNPDWSTLLFRRLWQHAEFRRDFVNRLADMLNTAFLPERVGVRLDAFRALYQPEITRHYWRWWLGNYDFIWLQNIEKTRFFANERPEYVRQEILSAAPEALAKARVTIDATPAGGGRVELNTVSPAESQLPWSGVYFEGVPVPVRAIANPGFEFVGWSDSTLGQADTTVFFPLDSMKLVAIFEAIDTTTIDTSDVDTTTIGVIDLDRVQQIFPNPVTDYISIEDTGLSDNELAHIRIAGADGRVVLTQSIRADRNGRLTLNLPQLSAGTYILKLEGKSSGRRSVWRFVVARR